MSAIFIAGTGTDVGKTFVACGLIHELRRRGREVEALKPVASGFDPDHPATSDPGQILEALGQAPSPSALDRIAPWRLIAPLSPDMAARRENRSIDFAALLAFCRRAVAASADATIIEGVGGIMAPLDETNTVVDWMTALRVKIVLVGGSYLGAISHALTALDALARRELDLAAMIVNETPGSRVDLGETAATIERFARGVAVAALPRLANAEAGHPALRQIADLL